MTGKASIAYVLVLDFSTVGRIGLQTEPWNQRNVHQGGQTLSRCPPLKESASS